MQRRKIKQAWGGQESVTVLEQLGGGPYNVSFEGRCDRREQALQIPGE